MAFNTSPIKAVLAALLCAALAPSVFAKPRAAAPLKDGDGVLLVMKEGQENAGLYKGRVNGQIRLDIFGGELLVDPTLVAKIRRISPLKAEFLCRKASMGEQDSAGHWKLAQWARQKGLKPEALSEAKAATQSDGGHAEAERFLKDPTWPNDAGEPPPLINLPPKRR